MTRLAVSMALAAAIGVAAAHPELRWLSEFRRVGQDGAILAPDSVGSPREVLSPAVPRNGYATFRLVVSAPADKTYTLHFGANPETLVKHTVYREVFAKDGGNPIPNGLEEVTLPATGVLGGDRKVDVFLVDMLVPGHVGVRRVRVEAQLNVGDDWIISPLELRLQQAAIPPLTRTAGTVAAVGANIADTAYSALRGFVCGRTEPYSPAEPDARAFIRRNVAQDIALARSLETKATARGQLMKTLAAAISPDDIPVMCGQRPSVERYDPEAYFKVREYLYRLAAE